ncbi:MAG: hypothetical protein FD180_2560 [Planctomycetota bacterium]|nr:MAG: hypothetical protein FD180_2560 [Planctomycetota bacterium]
MTMAETGNSLEGVFSLLFWAVVIGGSVLYSATKKKRQARELENTQEQLRRVDEAIRAARARAAAQASQSDLHAHPRAASEDASVPYEVSAPAVIPVALPDETSLEGPARPGAWEAARSGAAGWKHAAEHEGPSRPGTFESDREKPQMMLSSTAVRAAAGFAPATHAELREALVWREIFGPCAGMRR